MRPPPCHLLALFLVLVSIFSKHVNTFESLVQAQGEVRKDFPVRPLRFASPDWTIYHRTPHLFRHITDISRHCSHAHLSANIAVPGESLSPGGALSPDRHVYPNFDDIDTSLGLSSASDGLLYLTLRSKPADDDSSPARKFADGLLRRARMEKNARVMFVFGEEGRDLLTSEIALRVLRDVCGESGSNSTDDNADAPPRSRLKDGVELVLVPVANPDGRRISEMGRRCDRTNANDVDVDRNWPSFWGETGVKGDPPDTSKATTKKPRGILRAAVARSLVSRTEPQYLIPPSRGVHPFSEPETRALRAIVEKMRPDSYVSVRTGAVAVTVPWDCKPALLANAQRAKLMRVAETIMAGHCTRCKSGNLWNVTGHVKCGTGIDYMYGTLRVPFVHAWHVYDVPAPRGDCFRRHNPVSRNGYDRVTENWANAVFNFSNGVFNWVTLENSKGVHVAERNASLSAAEASARRAEALARGFPDPERDEVGKANSHLRGASNGFQQNPAPAAGKRVNKGNTPISWIFKGVHHTTVDTFGATEVKRNVGPMAPEMPVYVAEDTDNTFLTGLWGVWVALIPMGAGFYVAKRYVFPKGPRRSRFLNHSSVKHA